MAKAVKKKPKQPRRQLSKEEQEEVNQKLLQACANRDLDEVLRQIDAGADITATMSPHDPSGVLHQATRKIWSINPKKLDNPDLVAELVHRGANIDQQNAEGRTPLYQAALNRLPKTVVQLLELGADATIRCDAGRTPLYWAMYGDRELWLYQALCIMAPECIGVRDGEEKTPLHWAAERGHLEVVEFLLGQPANQPANVFARDCKGKRPVDLVPEAYTGVSNGAQKAEDVKMALWLEMEQREVDDDQSVI